MTVGATTRVAVVSEVSPDVVSASARTVPSAAVCSVAAKELALAAT